MNKLTELIVPALGTTLLVAGLSLSPLVLADVDDTSYEECLMSESFNDDTDPSVNTAPVFKPISDQTVETGSEIAIRLDVCDAEGDVPATVVPGMPFGAVLADNNDGTRTFLWTLQSPGTFEITFIAYDESEPEIRSSTSVQITVVGSDIQVNTPPVFTSLDDVDATVGELLQLVVAPTDPDGNVPGVYIENAPDGSTFEDNQDGSRTFRWQPSLAGSIELTFVATDPADPAITTSKTIVVTISGESGNQAPFIDMLADASVIVGETLEVRVVPIDPEGIVPGVYVENPPANSTFEDNNDGSRTFSWTPAIQDTGTVAINFVATDDADFGLSTTQTLTVTVMAADGIENSPPTITPVANQVLTVGDSLSVVIAVDDADGTIPVVTADGLPEGATFTDSETNIYQIDWTPALADVGTSEIQITAVDSEDTSVQSQLTFTVTVQDEDAQPVNYSIVLDSSIPASSTSPTSAFTAAGQVIDLGGTGLPASVEWVNRDSSGSDFGNGTIEVDADGFWSGEILLSQGVNTITFTILETTVSSTIEVIFNGGYAFGGQLDLQPDVAYVDEPREFTVRIALSDPQTVGSIVNLVSSTTGSTVATLTDDGDLANGDEIEADGIFSGIFGVNASEVGTLMYQVQVNIDGGGAALSEPVSLLVAEHLDGEEIAAIVSRQELLQQRLDSSSEENLASETVLILAELESNPAIAQIGVNDGGQGIWFVYSNGVAGALYTPKADTKGGRSAESEATLNAIDRSRQAVAEEETSFERSAAPAPYSAYCSALAGSARDGLARIDGEGNVVNSSKALAIASRYHDWGEDDDIPQMQQLLEDNGCFDVTYKRYESPGSGSVEDFKNMGSYGVIMISGEGDVFYNDLEQAWIEKFGWDGDLGQVLVNSNMAVTQENLGTYEDDLLKGRLVFWGTSYGITPTFISEYAGKLPNSLVYMSACRGTANASMAQAFLNNGAGTFLGYDDYVSVQFCAETGPPLLTTLLQDGMIMQDAFTPGLLDPYGSDQAEFKLFGANDLEIEESSLLDTGFESGNINQAWTVSGDARIITVLGDTLPTEGSNTAIISTGLGFVTDSGAMSQNFCLCDELSSISFDWNFFSAEYPDWIGSRYQDSFTAVITDADDPDNQYVMLNESVDSLAPLVAVVSNTFDRGDVSATGWQGFAGNIPESLRGKTVTIKFETMDVGDSIYDSAVLIDNISLVCEDAL